MAKFKLGDVVQLKSDGPKMTVVLVATSRASSQSEIMAYNAYRMKFGESEAYYGCCWFENVKKYEGAFPEEALVYAK